MIGAHTWRPVLPIQPPDVCRSCWNVWRARKPQPIACYCPHTGGAVRRIDNGLQAVDRISAYALASLRAADLL
jgi:hypothetical protein